MPSLSNLTHATGWRRLRLADPGAFRLRFAVALVVSMAAAALAAWGVAKWTDQLQIVIVGPTGEPMSIVYHASAMMIGAILALVMLIIPLPANRKIRGSVLAVFPVVFYLGTLIGTAIGQTTATSIIGIGAFGVLLVLLQRWPKLSLMGLPMFFGLFTAVFTKLEFSQTGWVALIVAAAGVAVIVTQLALCPSEAKVVERTFRSFDAASDRLLARVAALVTGSPGNERRRRGVAAAAERVEMLAMVGDGQLSSPLHGMSTHAIDTFHVRSFDREAALSALASAALDFDRTRTTADVPEGVADCLQHLAVDDITGAEHDAMVAIDAAMIEHDSAAADAAAHAEYRLAVAVGHLVAGWHGVEEVVAEAQPIHEPGVRLDGTGGLPGSAGPTMALYADQPAVLGFAAPIFQRAVRMAVALAVASAVGYWISADRWYYGMFGAFSVMMSANGTSEHVRMGIERALGTALGAIVGVAIAGAFDGHLFLTYLVLFATVGVAFYFQRPSDTLSTFALTVMVTMLYLQMHTYDDNFLWDRVFETAMGGAVAVVVSLLVYRVPARRIARSAADTALTRLDEFLAHATSALTGKESEMAMRAAARRFQESVWTFGQTVAPVGLVRFSSDGPTTEEYAVLSAIADDAGRLARDISTAGPFPTAHHSSIESIGTSLSDSSRSIGEWMADRSGPPQIARLPELAELDYGLRSAGVPDAGAQLAVLYSVMDIEEHLIDLLNVGGAPSPHDEPAAPRLTPVPARFASLGSNVAGPDQNSST